ncbi:MAG: HAD family hydrolase, partial [Elusimicrobia bacterium]|nr:HAD family hydrolase [Elusimicrobiota bacterium]
RKLFDEAFYRCDDELALRFPLAGLSFKQTLELQVGCMLERIAPSRLALKTVISQRFLDDCRKSFERNRPLLARLKSRYRLGIVSNFYGNLQSVLASEDLAGYFDAVADSGVVGRVKPDREIFLHAARALGLTPADCLMVGDSVPRDMKGAEGLGMRHALLAPNPLARPCCPEAWRLGCLAELEGRLL